MEFGDTLDVGSSTSSGSCSDWESEDEDVLDNEDDVVDEALKSATSCPRLIPPRCG